MRSKEELTSLFTSYLSDRLSPAEIDTLVVDVMAGIENRDTTRSHRATQALAAPGEVPQPSWSVAFA